MAATGREKISGPRAADGGPEAGGGARVSGAEAEGEARRATAEEGLALVPSANGGGAPAARAGVQTPHVVVIKNARSDGGPFAEAELDARRLGWRGLLRALQIVRVLGLLSFYLYLDNYDTRWKFNRRMAARLREEALARGRVALFQEWSRDVDRRAVDKLMRLARRHVFRGADGSAE